MPEDVTSKVHQELSRYPKRLYPKGQILVFADETPTHVFYLVKGRVRQYDISAHGDELALNVFKPPAFFAMPWALNHITNHYFYKTEAATEAHLVPHDAIRHFLADNPDVTLDLLTRVYRGVEGVYGRLVQLMAGSAGSRLSHELLLESRRSGQSQPDGSVLLDLTEIDLAARTGLSRETVSREAVKLKNQGLLHPEGSRLVITDTDNLEQNFRSDIQTKEP